MKFEEILEAIEEADALRIDKYLDAAINRKRELYPAWEITYIAMERQSGKEKWEAVHKILTE